MHFDMSKYKNSTIHCMETAGNVTDKLLRKTTFAFLTKRSIGRQDTVAIEEGMKRHEVGAYKSHREIRYLPQCTLLRDALSGFQCRTEFPLFDVFCVCLLTSHSFLRLLLDRGLLGLEIL